MAATNVCFAPGMWFFTSDVIDPRRHGHGVLDWIGLHRIRPAEGCACIGVAVGAFFILMACGFH